MNSKCIDCPKPAHRDSPFRYCREHGWKYNFKSSYQVVIDKDKLRDFVGEDMAESIMNHCIYDGEP